MGRRGPPPNPNSKRTKDALARATAIGKAVNAPKGKPAAPASVKAPKAPSDVLERPAAAAFWAAHAGPLAAAGRLNHEHVQALAMLCHLHADCGELRVKVAEEGWVTADAKGQSINPSARLLRDARRDFLTGCREFGLTPAAETRFPPEATDDGEEEDAETAALRRFGLTG